MRLCRVTRRYCDREAQAVPSLSPLAQAERALIATLFFQKFVYISIPVLEDITQEKVVSVSDVSWHKFKAIEAQLKDNRNVRLSYLSGTLEIMSPIGEEHEAVKRTLGYLLEAYMREKGIRFYGRGGYTLQAPGYASGTQP
jgi:hypothetical protein